MNCSCLQTILSLLCLTFHVIAYVQMMVNMKELDPKLNGILGNDPFQNSSLC